MWSFLLHVLREPATAKTAMRFAIAGGIFLLTIAAMGALAFILRPVEMQAIIGTLAGTVVRQGS